MRSRWNWRNKLNLLALSFIICACVSTKKAIITVIKPAVVTDTVPNDTDDPAIWINPVDASKSLILGTDKDINGGLYVFNLEGTIDTIRSVKGLKRPNNVDIEYGLLLGGKPTDIAVVTERFTHRIRIYRLPDLTAIDNGGIEMFVGENGDMQRDLMGISMYRNNQNEVYAIVGRKTGPTDGTYLWQYQIMDKGDGTVTARLVRKFGKYSGTHEIEAIAVDDQLGHVYYADEGAGIRKYYADPGRGNEELALFGVSGFTEDREGISIYATGDSTGFILVSNQADNSFNIYDRNSDKHALIKNVKVSAIHSDGSEIVPVTLNKTFTKGLFVVMTDEKRFHYYRPEDILDLK